MNCIKKYDNIIMFTNGAIGDFLMVGLCADSVKKVLAEGKFTIITPRNTLLLKDLFSAYSHIHVLEINRRNFLNALTLLMRVMWRKNLVVNQGVLKRIPPFVQFLARLLMLRPGSVYLYFLQKETHGKRRERGSIVFDYHLSVYENLSRLLNTQNLNISSTVPLYHFVSDQSVLERYGLVHSSYIVIHPCASSPSRSLPAVRWAGIFEYIASNFPETKIVVTGSKQDNLFIKKIFETGASANSIVNLTSKLSMMELANIIDGSRGYVGVDTGITHLAGVLQKRSVIIGNLSNPCWLPSYNKNATILTESKNCTCNGQKGGNCLYQIGEEKYYKCMIDIPEESIHEGIRKMLN